MSEEERDDEAEETDDTSAESGLAELAESVRSRDSPASREDDERPEPPDVELSTVSDGDADTGHSEGPSGSGLERLSDELSGGAAPTPPTSPALAEASDVLLLEPSPSSTPDDCIALTTPDADRRGNILLLAVTRAAERRLSVWRAEGRRSASNTCVVTFGRRGRGRGQSPGPGDSGTVAEDSEADDLTVERVSDPSDLARLGITISRKVGDWQSNPHPTRVCFDSLTGMLQYVEPKRLFRFLHILQDKLESSDVRTHYHMDPDAHDEQVVTSFRPLFDAVIRRSADGSLEDVTRRE